MYHLKGWLGTAKIKFSFKKHEHHWNLLKIFGNYIAMSTVNTTNEFITVTVIIQLNLSCTVSFICNIFCFFATLPCCSFFVFLQTPYLSWLKYWDWNVCGAGTHFKLIFEVVKEKYIGLFIGIVSKPFAKKSISISFFNSNDRSLFFQ